MKRSATPALPSRMCVTCKHFDWVGIGYVYYSTLTGGDTTGGFSCNKSHYYESRPDDSAALQELFRTAQKCPDYDDSE